MSFVHAFTGTLSSFELVSCIYKVSMSLTVRRCWSRKFCILHSRCRYSLYWLPAV